MFSMAYRVQEQAGSQADAQKFIVFYAPENGGLLDRHAAHRTQRSVY
jgi:hypothetical protein